jgi:hypothetical protein
MKNTHKNFLAAFAVGALFVSFSIAAIPSGYIGLPYPPGSGPKEIPGRINFHEYDYVSPSKGKTEGVTFVQDDKAGMYGSASAGRDGKTAGFAFDSNTSWPGFYLTWHADHDTFYATGVTYPNGTPYPSSDTSLANSDWYIGASHPNGMTKFTIHVPKAGKYWISSIWGADAYPIKFHINFFNGATTVSTPTVTINGSGSYHAWRKYSDFASIQLDSGVQVMQFQNESYHLNQDFLFIAADSNQFTTGLQQPVALRNNHDGFNISFNQKSVRFFLPDAGMSKISIFDCLGREIGHVLNKNLAAGEHAVPVAMGNLKQGVYFLHIQHNATTAVMRFQAIGK